MAFDEGLATRLREFALSEPGLVEKPMFGGLCYLIDGNMAFGVLRGSLVVRVGPERFQEALLRPGGRVFDVPGRSMTGWVMVDSAGLEDDHAFAQWLNEGLAFARTLPPK